ncbi:MAG: DUF192 domain-containing protein [Actinomycetota bacterium]
MRRALLVLVILCACSSSQPPRLFDVAFRGRATVTIHAELADTDAARERGLMGRTSLAPNAGMLFTWPAPETHQFYMFKTLIPLDLVAIKSGRVTVVTTMTPCRSFDPDACPTYPTGVADAVLEIAGGTAARLGIVVGSLAAYHCTNCPA